jgi:acyl-CoA-binding protein
MASHPSLSTSMSIEDQLMFYGLHQQASLGPCNIPSPHLWNRVERAKWDVWKQLGNTSKIEAMFLYTRSVEEKVCTLGSVAWPCPSHSSRPRPREPPCSSPCSRGAGTTVCCHHSNRTSTPSRAAGSGGGGRGAWYLGGCRDTRTCSRRHGINTHATSWGGAWCSLVAMAPASSPMSTS